MPIFALIYAALIAGVAWFRWRYAVLWLAFTLPSYLIRFHIGPLPTTLLEITWAAVVGVWLLRYAKSDLPVLRAFAKRRPFAAILPFVFLASSVASIAVSDMVILSFGQWRAYVLEPLIFAIICIARVRSISPSSVENAFVVRTHVFYALGATVLVMALYGIAQALTGWGIATPEWMAAATRRVTLFYTSPNAVALFMVPIMLFIVTYLGEEWSAVRTIALASRREILKRMSLPVILAVVTLLLSLVCLAATKSAGGVAALGAGLLVIAVGLRWYKLVLLGVVGVVAAIAFVAPVREQVLFRDQAGKNRFTLWSYTTSYLTASPQNFVFGPGFRQFFRKVQKPHYDVKALERLIYPHNIVLNFWTETGLLGMLAMFALLGYAVVLAMRQVLTRASWPALGAVAVVAAFVMHGLVDVPYFKNDLAFLWWITLALVFAADLETA